jgi:hypothetical protein
MSSDTSNSDNFGIHQKYSEANMKHNKTKEEIEKLREELENTFRSKRYVALVER